MEFIVNVFDYLPRPADFLAGLFVLTCVAALAF
jgi:hypothetical protein